MTATLVLVHGAWHGAWCWDPILPALREAGISFRAVDLPGHGADQRPCADLVGDADAVRAVLDEVSGPVVLVGHSYGGAVITDAGSHPNVAHLVFVTAFVLDESESLIACAVDELAAAGIDAIDPKLGAGITMHDDGTSTLDPALVAALIYNECDDAMCEWARDRVGRQALASSAQSPRSVAWRERPSTYVVCERDRLIHPQFQRILAARCSETITLPADHSPFASTPDELAAFLVAIANRV